MKQLLHTILKSFFCLSLLILVAPPNYAKEQSEFNKIESNKAKSILTEVIGTLADYKTFRKNSKVLDALFGKYCTKKETIKSGYAVSVEYTCDASTGIESINFDSTEQAGHPNYLMTLSIDFVYKDYSKIKQLVTKKLGPANRNWKDYTGWEYKSDKYLNDQGNPVISVVRDKKNNSAYFGIGLEQGEDER